MSLHFRHAAHEILLSEKWDCRAESRIVQTWSTSVDPDASTDDAQLEESESFNQLATLPYTEVSRCNVAHLHKYMAEFDLRVIH